MSATAVVMMILSLVLVWGGLAASIVYLVRHPLREETPAGAGEGFGTESSARNS